MAGAVGATQRRGVISPKKRTKVLKREKLPVDEKEGTGTRRGCAGFLLIVVAWMDNIATVSTLPVITLHGEAIPFMLGALVVSQALYFFPQLWSAGLVERVAKRLGATMAYAMTLMATSIATFLNAIALRERSLYIYLLVRLMNGLLRHNITLGFLATYETSGSLGDGGPMWCTVLSVICAMLLGGIMGDYELDLASMMDKLAFIELAAAIVVGVLSFTLRGKPKTLPAVYTLKAYKGWLLREPPKRIAAFVPVSLVTVFASVSECMYPFTDRRVFHLTYSFIGLHVAFVFLVKGVVAPLLVKKCSAKLKSLMIHICTTLILFGAWLSPWVTRNGITLYFTMTLLFVDLPAAVLDLSLGSAALSSFGPADKVFSEKLYRHAKFAMKQWSPILLVFFQFMFSNHEDTPRLVMAPIALGVAAFVLTHRVAATLTALVAVYCLLMVVHPVDDEAMWTNMVSFFKWHHSSPV